MTIEAIQRAAWHFLWAKTNPDNGLVPDHYIEGKDHVPGSIAVTGMALTALPVAVENGWVKRADAARRAHQTLRFFARDARQYGGFFFHFLDLKTGERAWKCEVSSVDSTILFLGCLFCAAYFDRATALESEIRALANEIFARADWNWFCHDHDAVSIAFTPERGFSRHLWRGYNEALLVPLLALGSPTAALPSHGYAAWTRDYRFKTIYGHHFLYCGPLFTHIFPHLWLDLRDVSDEIMRERGWNYFQNTRRAIQIQAEWAKRRGDNRVWGVSSCDGPSGGKLGGYRGRSAPFGRFDGVFSPPICLAALPFAPDLGFTAWENWMEKHPDLVGDWGVRGAIKPSSGWTSGFFGLDQGMLVLMLENFRSGLLWQLSREVKPLQIGLERAGFRVP